MLKSSGTLRCPRDSKGSAQTRGRSRIRRNNIRGDITHHGHVKRWCSSTAYVSQYSQEGMHPLYLSLGLHRMRVLMMRWGPSSSLDILAVRSLLAVQIG